MENTKILAPALFIALLLAGCSTSAPTADSGKNIEKGSQAAGTQMSMAPVKPPELTTQQLDELKAGMNAHAPASLTFNVGGGNYYFVPDVIKVKQGDKVKIVFTNNGGFHNFVLDAFGVKFDPIQTGETKVVEFLADKKGRYEYYCSVANHRQKGQRGMLVIE